MNLLTRMRAFRNDDRGQDLLEYALLVGLIALGAIAAVSATGGSIDAAFGRIPEELDEAGLTNPQPAN
jgi:Flp pilus assembly pilin Flp